MHPGGTSGMGWSWGDLEHTPPYVRYFTWDLLQIKRAEINRRNEQH